MATNGKKHDMKFSANKFSFKMREITYLKAKNVQNFIDMLHCMFKLILHA